MTAAAVRDSISIERALFTSFLPHYILGAILFVIIFGVYIETLIQGLKDLKRNPPKP